MGTVEEALNWPIAPGNSITFKIENGPYICTKTKGFSQLEEPVFEKYRLVKEDEPIKPHPEIKREENPDLSLYALKSDVERTAESIDYVKKELEKLKTDLERKTAAQSLATQEKEDTVP